MQVITKCLACQISLEGTAILHVGQWAVCSEECLEAYKEAELEDEDLEDNE